VAIISFTAGVFSGTPEAGSFQDAGAVAVALGKHHSHLAGVLFAVALIDASLIGASAVSLSTAYALGDVLSLKHSLHRKPTDALGFYAVYFLLIAGAAALVLIPGVPLGLLTNAVQTLAGVLLPSATVFLLMLCNDKEVLGPWVNSRATNLFTGLIVAALVLLSIILTASVLWPDLSSEVITDILVGGGVLSVIVVLAGHVLRLRKEADSGEESAPQLTGKALYEWRMPPLAQLKPMLLSKNDKLWMAVLRGYLVVAVLMVVYKVVQVAMA
jgi:hypothetical protein